MKQAIFTISAMCMFSALCTQLLASNKHLHTLRMILGLQVFLTVVTLMDELFQMLN